MHLFPKSILKNALALGLFLTLFTGVGCAHQKEKVEFEPMKIVAEPTGPDALETYDAETLFARGLDLYKGDAAEEAAEYFERITQEFSDSPQAQPSFYHLAVCYIRTENGEKALAAIDTYLEAYPDDAPESEGHLNGLFRRGQALAILKRYTDAVELYDWLITLPLKPADMIEALTDAGVSHFMSDDRITAEYRFMKARRIYKEASKTERLQVKYFVAQSAFYLAELARLEFSEFKLTYPKASELKGEVTLESAMGQQLEEKCQRLLRAQYAFTRTVREGHAGWASASGYKVGQMYEELHGELSSLPVPDDLPKSAKALFTQMLEDRILILLEKALSIWQSTAEMAVRTEEDNLWVNKTKESLERLRAVVLTKKEEREERLAAKAKRAM